MLTCDNCGKIFSEDEAVVTIEDDTFTAPFGDTFADGGGKYEVYECPDCGAEVGE